MLIDGVCAPRHAQTIDRGHTQGGGEVPVAPSSGGPFAQLESKRSADALGLLEQRATGRGPFHGGAVDPPVDLQTGPGVSARRSRNSSSTPLGFVHRRYAYINTCFGMGGDDVGSGPAFDQAHVDGRAEGDWPGR